MVEQFYLFLSRMICQGFCGLSCFAQNVVQLFLMELKMTISRDSSLCPKPHLKLSKQLQTMQ